MFRVIEGYAACKSLFHRHETKLPELLERPDAIRLVLMTDLQSD